MLEQRVLRRINAGHWLAAKLPRRLCPLRAQVLNDFYVSSRHGPKEGVSILPRSVNVRSAFDQKLHDVKMTPDRRPKQRKAADLSIDVEMNLRAAFKQPLNSVYRSVVGCRVYA